MQAAAQRMQGLIADLLAFSSTAWDDAPFERISLRDVLRDVSNDLETTLEQSHGSVHIGPLPSIEADRSLMLRLFTNLVGNALKFRRPDAAPRVQISAVLLEAWQGSGADARGEAACQIVVSDNGIGFDSRHAERIFVPFRRLHGKDVYPGNGMGLAICRKIVERHRGTIQARGTPGVGAEFIVTLPVRQPHS
jgi:signal transduction histidine kinase